MKRLLRDAGALASKAWFFLPVGLAALMGYGFNLTHFTVSPDDLSLPYYLESLDFIRGGRAGGLVTVYALGFGQRQPFAEELAALALLLVSAVLWCVLLRRASDNKLKKACYPLFACLYITYPLINEIWVFTGANWRVAAGYAMTALALIWTEQFFREKKPRYLIWTALLLALALANYESFAFVFILGVLMVLLMRMLYGAPEDGTCRVILQNGLMAAGALAAGLIVEWAFSWAAIWITGSGTNFTDATRALQYFWSEQGFMGQVKALLEGFAIYYGLLGLWYLPIGVLIGCVLLAAALMFVYTRRGHRCAWLLILGLMGTLLLLPLVKGAFTGYRTCQTFAPFTAFILTLGADELLRIPRKRLGTALVALMFLLSYYQAVDLDGWFELEYERGQEEAAVLEGVNARLTAEFGYDKPVVFVGKYALSDRIMDRCSVTSADPVYAWVLDKTDSHMERFKYVDTNIDSVLAWGLTAFGQVNGEILRYDAFLGYGRMKQGSWDMYNAANALAKDAPAWPARESMMDGGAFIAVKLGPILAD